MTLTYRFFGRRSRVLQALSVRGMKIYIYSSPDTPALATWVNHLLIHSQYSSLVYCLCNTQDESSMIRFTTWQMHKPTFFSPLCVYIYILLGDYRFFYFTLSQKSWYIHHITGFLPHVDVEQLSCDNEINKNLIIPWEKQKESYKEEYTRRTLLRTSPLSRKKVTAA